MLNQYSKELHVNLSPAPSQSLFIFPSVHFGTGMKLTNIKNSEENIGNSKKCTSQNY
jgi:hypothetical protein